MTISLEVFCTKKTLKKHGISQNMQKVIYMNSTCILTQPRLAIPTRPGINLQDSRKILRKCYNVVMLT